MKKTFLIVIFVLTTVSTFAKKPSNYFTQQDNKNWVYVIKDKQLDPASLFNMENGILKISNASTGYLRTQKEHKNFNLFVEWRWTKVAGNSGVLVYIQPKDSIWPVCYQVQQKTDAAGDIICMNGLWANECKDSVKFTIPKLQPSNERPIGEWNALTVKCKGGKMKVFVNGILQNNISGLTAKKGFIGFQAEGKPMEFKNLILE